MSFKEGKLKCDMHHDCARSVEMIDDKGFAYCAIHGEIRKAYHKCRKLQPHELNKLKRGEALTRY